MDIPTPRFLVAGLMVWLGTLAGPLFGQDAQQPFVVRTFGFFDYSSDTASDYFLADHSVAVIAVPGAYADTFYFAPCEDINGELAGTTWVLNAAVHATIGHRFEHGQYAWLLSDRTPAPPPAGATTLTGPDSPLVISQQVVRIGLWSGAACDQGRPGDWVVSAGGVPFVVVTAVFFR